MGPCPGRQLTSDLPTILPHQMAADLGGDSNGITPSCRSSPPGLPCTRGAPGRWGRAKRVVRQGESDGQGAVGALPWGWGGHMPWTAQPPVPRGLGKSLP